MRITRKNIYFHELIGLKITVLDYPDPSIAGVSGRIIDETRKTLLIETSKKRIIRLLKQKGVFEITLPTGEKVIIRGSQILARPEDRLKNMIK